MKERSFRQRERLFQESGHFEKKRETERKTGRFERGSFDREKEKGRKEGRKKERKKERERERERESGKYHDGPLQ